MSSDTEYQKMSVRIPREIIEKVDILVKEGKYKDRNDFFNKAEYYKIR